MNEDIYIVIYNEGHDFYLGANVSTVETQVKQLIAEGYAPDDIQAYQSRRLRVEVDYAHIRVMVT